MQFLIMHRTNAHWESGAVPTPELIERVGSLIGELARSGRLLAGDGLRPSSLGVRLQFARGTRTIQRGPFAESRGLIAGFTIFRLKTIEDAVEWTTKLAQVVGDFEADIRPVTEAWDLGFAEKPQDLATTRYLATHKYRGGALSPKQNAAMGQLLEEMERAGVLLSSVSLEPEAKGACLRMANGKPVVIDGPFTESKELLGGFIIIRADSLQDAVDWALRYHAVVTPEQVEVRQQR